VTGCQNDTVGPVIRGTYSVYSENHGRPVYRRSEQSNNVDVLIYFWDERDGPSFSGWWFGPRIGGDQVWAYNAEKSMTPPTSNWQVPYDGPVDTSFMVHSAGGQDQSQQGYSQGYQYQQSQQPQQPQQQGYGQQVGYDPHAAWREQQQKQQEEERRRNEQMQQEQKRQQEEAWKKEQNAASAIRQAIQKLRNCSPDSLDSTNAEMQQVWQNVGNDSGSLWQTLQQEVNQAQLSAQERKVQYLKDKEEEDKKSKEREAVTAQLLQELSDLVATAEGTVTALKEQTQPVVENGVLVPSELDTKTAGFREAKVKAKAGCRACTDFLIAKRPTMEEARSVASETKQQLVQLQQKLHAAFKLMSESVNGVESKIDAAIKKEKASKLVEKREVLFQKYDANKDGFWNQQEVVAYSKGEFSFDVPKSVIDKLLKLYGSAKGVAKKDMHYVRTAVGVAREEAASRKRREEAEKRRKEVEAEKEALQGKIDGLTKTVEALEHGVAESETASKEPAEATVGQLQETFSRGEATLAAVKASVDEAKTEVQAADNSCSEENKSFLQGALRPLSLKLEAFSGRLTRVSSSLTKLQGDIKKKESAGNLALRSEVVSALRRHVQKSSLRGEELFKAADKDGDGQISEADFLALASGFEEGFDQEKLKRFFLNEVHEESKLTKDDLLRLASVYYKVVANTTMTKDFVIKDSEALRRLDVGEVFVSQEAPEKDEGADVMRVRGKAMQDDLEGYASLAGNGGTMFLVEGADVFKVMRAVDLTDTLSFEGAAPVRKLHEGELLQVLVWEKKDANSDAKRMKAKAQLDGAVGWVTTFSGEGVPFLQVAC